MIEINISILTFAAFSIAIQSISTNRDNTFVCNQPDKIRNGIKIHIINVNDQLAYKPRIIPIDKLAKLLKDIPSKTPVA